MAVPAVPMQTTAHSHTLNEAVCPVQEHILSNLCGPNPADATDIALSYSPKRRAQLAYFCYNRQHMKTLAHKLILSCEKSELRAEFGGITDMVIEQTKVYLKEQESSGQSLSFKLRGLSAIK